MGKIGRQNFGLGALPALIPPEALWGTGLSRLFSPFMTFRGAEAGSVETHPEPLGSLLYGGALFISPPPPINP